MALHTCVASTDYDLTTTSAVKALLGTTATSDDATISALIRSASRWAETFVGYPLSLATYQETVAAYGRRNLMLSRTPVRAVGRLFSTTSTEDESQVYTSEYRVEDRDAGLLSQDAGWPWSVPSYHDLSLRPLAGEEFKPWLVEYVAGYTYGGLTTDSVNWSTEAGTTSTGRTLPEDLEHAIKLRVVEMYSGAEGVTSEKLGDLEVNYSSLRTDPATELSIPEKLLGPYKRLV